MTVEVRVSDDPAREAAELLAAAAVAGAQLALSGGSTVGKAYALAAQLRPRWEGVTVWFGDERAVDPEDALEVRAACTKLQELAQDATFGEMRRARVTGVLRLLRDRGCLLPEKPAP